MEKIQSFKQLRVWQKGIEIVKEIYGLTSQMRRAAISIPANIAEGFKRLHGKEYRQFLHIALGSAAELETELIIARELSFINEQQLSEISEKLDHVSKMMSSLLRKLS